MSTNLQVLIMIQIVDTAKGDTLGANQKGEIYLRGPNLMKGYHNNKQATEAAIDRDGWLHTGNQR